MKKLFILLLISVSTLSKAQLPNYIPILVGDKYGFCDSNKKMLIEPQFDLVYMGAKSYWVEKGDKTFLMDPNSGARTAEYEQLQSQYYYNYGETYPYNFSNEHELIYKENYQTLSKLSTGIRNDTTFYFYGIPDTVIYSIAHKQTENRVTIFDTGCKWVIADTGIYTRKGKIYTTKNRIRHLGDNYFEECDKCFCGILKLNGDTVQQLTRIKYDIIHYDKANNNFKVLKCQWKQKDKYEYIFDTIGFVNSFGNDIGKIKFNSRISKEYPSFGMDLFQKGPSIDGNLLIYGYIYIRDSVTGEWPDLYYTYLLYSGKAGENYIVLNTNNEDKKTYYKYGVINNRGQGIIPFKYKVLSHVKDSLLSFADSNTFGLTTMGGKVLYSEEYNDSVYPPYIYYYSDANWFEVSSPRIQKYYKFENSTLVSLDTAIVNSYYRSRQTPSPNNSPNNYWSLMSKDVWYDYKQDTGTFIYCDSLLINPHIPAIHYSEFHKMLFIITDTANQTWIIDNKGNMVYNTGEEYKHEIDYRLAGKINHLIIRIFSKKRKLITNIRWPALNGKFIHTQHHIERFIDSFTVFKINEDYDNMGLMDKGGNILIPPRYSDINYIKFEKDDKTTYWFNVYSRNEGYSVYNDKGELIFKDGYAAVDGSRSCLYAVSIEKSPWPRKDKLVFFDKYGTIYWDK